MSRKKTTKKDEIVDSQVDDRPDSAESIKADEVAEQMAPEPPDRKAKAARRNGSGFVAWLALVVSAVAIAAFAFDFLRDRGNAGDAAESSAEVRALSTSLGATKDALTSLEQSITTLNALDAERKVQIDSIDKQLIERFNRNIPVNCGLCLLRKFRLNALCLYPEEPAIRQFCYRNRQIPATRNGVSRHMHQICQKLNKILVQSLRRRIPIERNLALADQGLEDIFCLSKINFATRCS